MYKGQTCDLVGYSICRLCAMLYGSGIPEASIFYFFYSQEVWSELLLRNRCGSSHFLLSELIPWVNLHASGFSLASTILKISVSATVYRIGRREIGGFFNTLRSGFKANLEEFWRMLKLASLHGGSSLSQMITTGFEKDGMFLRLCCPELV